MIAIEDLLRQPAAQAIGWALIHFVWQGALIGVMTGAALTCLRKGAADIRYVVGAIGLSLMLTLPVVTAMQVWRSATVVELVGLQRDTAPAVATSALPAAITRAVQLRPIAETPSVATARFLDSLRWEPWLPMLVLGWLCGVVMLSLRLLSGWLWVQRIRSHGATPAGDGWQHIASRLSRRLHIARHVQLLESAVVDVPTVIGWIKPVILLPASALAGLNPHQLEAILAHELAHIRRHDYLVNLLQTVVETLLFYHPAVWWLSRRIRAERENCCDDLAVSLCGDPYTYAAALAELEGLRGASGRFAMAANGGSLVQRVRRVLGAPSHDGRAPGWLAASASLLVMIGIGAGAVGTDAFQTATSAPTTTSGTAADNSPSTDEPQAVAAEAKDMQRKARLYDTAARAAAWAEDVTAHTSTPFLASGPLASKAAAFAADAHRMGAQATSSTAATTPVVAQSRAVLEASTAMSRAVVALEVAATAVAGVQVSVQSSQSHGTFSWSNNGEKLEVRYDGDVEFTDDDMDVKRLSPGGLLRIRDGGMMTSLLGGHTIEFTADGSGNVSRRFWVGTSERPFDPEGRRWLSSVLPRFIRQTGIGAEARVARILKAKGASGVLAEISLVEGSWAKRKYFSVLLKTPLDASTIRQVLTQAGREMDSDYELASLLIENTNVLLVDDAARQAYIDASRSIGSDYEMRRVYSAVVKRTPLNPTLLASLLGASRSIESDYEQATLLVEVARLQPLDNTTRPAFFSALESVQNDYEHGRVLKALGERGDLAPETTSAMLVSGATVGSDYEAATFLLQLLKQQSIEGALRAPFFRAVESIGSAFERGRVLKAAAKRPDASPETVHAIIRAAAGMASGFEVSQVLLAVSSSHPVEGSARDSYIDVAGKLGDFEQGQVLAALVRSERRK